MTYTTRSKRRSMKKARRSRRRSMKKVRRSRRRSVRRSMKKTKRSRKRLSRRRRSVRRSMKKARRSVRRSMKKARRYNIKKGVYSMSPIKIYDNGMKYDGTTWGEYLSSMVGGGYEDDIPPTDNFKRQGEILISEYRKSVDRLKADEKKYQDLIRRYKKLSTKCMSDKKNMERMLINCQNMRRKNLNQRAKLTNQARLYGLFD